MYLIWVLAVFITTKLNTEIIIMKYKIKQISKSVEVNNKTILMIYLLTYLRQLKNTRQEVGGLVRQIP